MQLYSKFEELELAAKELELTKQAMQEKEEQYRRQIEEQK